MEILIDVESGKDAVDVSRIESLVKHAAYELNLPKNSEISISFIDDEQMRELNSRYRNIDSTTDVLSFECDGLEDDFPSLVGGGVAVEGHAGVESDVGSAADTCSPTNILGDIMISPEVAKRQAQEYATSLSDEIDLLIVHGILHLCGYDHIDDEDAKQMETLQESILASWRKEA